MQDLDDIGCVRNHCDICKKYIDKYEHEGFDHSIHMLKKIDSPTELMDICKKCQNKIAYFVTSLIMKYDE